MTKEDLEDIVHELCITENDKDYFAKWESDDQGPHMSVYIEGKIENAFLKKLHNLSKKHRVVVISTPIGYIGSRFQN